MGLTEGFCRGGADCATERAGTESTVGELGMEGEVVEDVGGGDGRGRLRGSFTLPSRGGGTPGAPGRWIGGV